jgi:hypothetical protein
MFKSSLRNCAIIACAITLLAAVRIVHAESLASQLQLEPIYQAKDAINIPITAKPGTASIECPSAPAQPGKVLFMKFRAFYPVEKYGIRFANCNLQIKLNGKSLGMLMPDETYRILNRGAWGRHSDGRYPWWDGDCLMTYFGLETGEMDSRIIEPREEGYWYVVNISDLAEYVKTDLDWRVVGGKPNEIVFTSTLTDTSPNPNPKAMRIEDLSVGYLPREVVDKIQPTTPIAIPALEGKTLKSRGQTLTVTQSGAMLLKSGGDTYAFKSGFSYPSDTIKYHQFTWEAADDADWKTDFVSGSGKGKVSVKGESAKYSVTRTVSAKDGKFFVEDTILNKTDAPLGMVVHDVVAVPQRLTGAQAYMSGVPGELNYERCAYNPTVFLKQPETALGIVAEDAVFNCQLSMERKVNSVQFGTEHFGLEPGKSYTLKWTLYPQKDQDYFSFVNRLRDDMKVNFTIPGPWAFVVKPEVLSNKEDDRKIAMFVVPPWFHFQDGVGLSDDEYAATLKAQIDKVHAKYPDAIAFPKIETPSTALLRKDIPGSEIIPKTPKQLPLALDDKATEVLKHTPWWDSMETTSDGHALIDTWYTDDKVGDLDFLVYPMLGNSQYKHMLYQIDYCMDKIGCKGIYMDMFEFDEVVGQSDRGDYGKWDGHTVDIDGKGEIARKYTDTSLASIPARKAIVEHILSKGGTAVTNMHPASWEMRTLPYISFAEADYEVVPDFATFKRLLTPAKPELIPRMAMGHLCSPVTLGLHMWFNEVDKDYGRSHRGELIQKYVIVCLRNAQLFYEYGDIPRAGEGAAEYGIINYMFPFTPVELHEGYMIGKERILTAVSGTFRWNHADKPVVKTFDTKGREKIPDVVMKRKGSAWDVTIKLQDWNATAVIMGEKT